MVRELVGGGEFVEVFVDTPIDDCRARDPKGLYAKAAAGQIKNFTGIDCPMRRPNIQISGLRRKHRRRRILPRGW